MASTAPRQIEVPRGQVVNATDDTGALYVPVIPAAALAVHHKNSE